MFTGITCTLSLYKHSLRGHEAKRALFLFEKFKQRRNRNEIEFLLKENATAVRKEIQF